MSEVQPLSGNWLGERTHLRKSLRRVDVTTGQAQASRIRAPAGAATVNGAAIVRSSRFLPVLLLPTPHSVTG